MGAGLPSFDCSNIRQWTTRFASARPASDEQAIRQLQDEWLKAYDAGDVKALDRIEGHDFTVAGEFGESTKQQQLDRIQRRAEKSQAVTRKIENQQFRFYGEVALVTRPQLFRRRRERLSVHGAVGSAWWCVEGRSPAFHRFGQQAVGGC